MTVQELQTKLFELDIPIYYYNICDDADDEDQKICLKQENGSWLVYFSDDGERTDLTEHTNEADACADCFDRLTK